MSISFELRWFCSFSERDCKAAVSFNESETAISFRATTFFDCFKRVIEMEGLTALSCMESNTSTCVHSHSVSPDHSFRHSESMTTCKSRSIECTRFFPSLTDCLTRRMTSPNKNRKNNTQNIRKPFHDTPPFCIR